MSCAASRCQGFGLKNPCGTSSHQITEAYLVWMERTQSKSMVFARCLCGLCRSYPGSSISLTHATPARHSSARQAMPFRRVARPSKKPTSAMPHLSCTVKPFARPYNFPCYHLFLKPFSLYLCLGAVFSMLKLLLSSSNLKSYSPGLKRYKHPRASRSSTIRGEFSLAYSSLNMSELY